MSAQITFQDCCRIILEDSRWRRAGAPSDRRTYHLKLLALLNEAFEIDWRDDEWGCGHDRLLPRIVLDMPQAYARLVGPFDGVLEYSPLPGEMSVIDRHKVRLSAETDALKELWIALFRDLPLLRWPGAADRRTTWSDLRRCGLGDPPDDDEFF